MLSDRRTAHVLALSGRKRSVKKEKWSRVPRTTTVCELFGCKGIAKYEQSEISILHLSTIHGSHTGVLHKNMQLCIFENVVCLAWSGNCSVGAEIAASHKVRQTTFSRNSNCMFSSVMVNILTTILTEILPLKTPFENSQNKGSYLINLDDYTVNRYSVVKNLRTY